jgi:hypothetical protein
MNNYQFIKLLTCFLIIFISCEENPCEEITCINNGVCIDGVCDCPEGFGGENCEVNLFDVKLLRSSEEFISDNTYFRKEYQYYPNGKIRSEAFIDENGIKTDSLHYYFNGDTLVLDHWTINSIYSAVLREKVYPLEEGKYIHEYFNCPPNGFDFTHSNITSLNPECGIDSITATTVKTFFEFNDDNCGHLQTSFKNGELTFHNRVTRDDKNSPCLNLWCHFYDYEIGNITSSEIADLQTDATGNIPLVKYNSIYTYNENNYPISETREYDDGRVFQLNYTYYE